MNKHGLGKPQDLDSYLAQCACEVELLREERAEFT